MVGFIGMGSKVAPSVGATTTWMAMMTRVEVRLLMGMLMMLMMALSMGVVMPGSPGSG